MRKGIDIIKQLKEKLGKSADAGDYIDDFKKSDAPQFKGKSDKKKEKMAIAAYLDSKEEVKEEKRQLKDPKKEAMVMKVKDSGSIQVIDKKDLEKYLRKGYIQVEDNIQEALKINYVLIDTSRNDKVIAMSSDEQGVKDSMRTANLPPLKVKNKSSLKIVKLKRPKGDNMAGKLIGEPLKSWGEETDIQESGHTDVASMKTQVQIATDALQKMNTELGKLSDEEDLPTWWTNKVATAVGKLDGMADYIDAKSDQGQKMNEEYKSLNESAIGCLQAAMIDNNKSLKEEKVFVVRFEKEGMRFAVPFRDMKMAKDGEKILKKSSGVSNLSVTQDILKPGIKLSRTQEGKIVKESKMGELFLDMQMDAQEMSERDFIKTYSKQGFQAAELKRMYKEFSEEVVKENVVIDTKDDRVTDQIAYYLQDLFGRNQSDISDVDLDSVYMHRTGKYKKGRITVEIDGEKKAHQKFMKDLQKKYGNKIKVSLDMGEEVDNSLMAQATRVISHTSIKEKIDPADVDDVATADDRKAADKNIIIQLRRAQDMKGKADVTFKNNPKKKEKIDIKIINKALDMFDSLRPNDKAKMQTTIGKSYRDLLKTVQRGR